MTAGWIKPHRRASHQPTRSNIWPKQPKEENGRNCAAFKIEQEKLEEEVSTVTCSLTTLTEDILGIRCDMPQLSTNICVELEALKKPAPEYFRQQNRTHTKEKQRYRRSISLVDQGGEHWMEV
jgi:hypothetical protein